MPLDSFTIKITTVLLSTIMAITMYAMHRANKAELSFLDWAGAGFFNVLGYLAATALQSESISIDISLHAFFIGAANTCYFLAHCAILRGLLRYFGHRLFTTEIAFIALIYTLMHQLPLIHESFENRILLFLLLIFSIKAASIYLLTFGLARTKQWSYLPLLVIELCFAAQLGIRTYAAVLLESPADLNDVNHPIQTFGWLFDVLYISVATLACVLIVVRKQVLAIQKLSLTDQLSGCLNRRALQDRASMQFEQSKRSNAQFGVIIVDIDFFKRINDTHGHDVGDLAIKHIAKTINNQLRKADSLYRLGGEEFVVTAVGTDIDGLETLAEKIRTGVESNTLTFSNNQLTITVSIGISLAQPDDSKWEQTLTRADTALYQAKSNGRNRVVISNQLTPAYGLV